MTDIHDLDQYVGRYVEITDPDGEGASGFLVDVLDEVEYQPHPTRMILLDYGYGWPVGEKTQFDVLPSPPTGQEPPGVTGAIDVLHEAAHGGDCPSGNCRARARTQLRALRIWRMKQQDMYWEKEYVSKIRSYAKSGDGHEVGDAIRDATHEGAPPHMIDRMKRIAADELKESAPGQPDGPNPGPDWDPFGDADKSSGH